MFLLDICKILTVGDGGMITTRNSEWDKRFRLLRQHGMDVSDAVRHGSRKVVIEEYPIPGDNYRMTDIQAAVGREQLKRLPGIMGRSTLDSPGNINGFCRPSLASSRHRSRVGEIKLAKLLVRLPAAPTRSR